MFPIRDHNPSERTPFVTYGLMALNTLVFLATLPMFADAAQLRGFLNEWALIPAQISQGAQFYGILTSMFLHGGWLHLAGNMLFLWIFGDNLEDELGHAPFLGFYLVVGIVAAVAQWLSDPTSTVPTVGASGAIAGVMGGYLLMFPKARVDILFIIVIIFRIIPVPAWLMLGLWFALQLFNGVTTTTGTGGVAYWEHTGGFVIGLLLMLPHWLRRGGTGYWQRTHGHPEHPEARYSPSRIPTVRRHK